MSRRVSPAALIALLAVLCALLLALPGRTVTGAFVNDVLIFLDGAHRIHSGQLPNREFHTSLGPMVYAIPAAGYALTGSLGAALPVGMALLLLAYAGAVNHVLCSRLRPALAMAAAAFLLLLLAVPINLGDRVSALSFAMFYNRIGWAAIALLLVMYLPAREATRRQGLWDAACAAALTLLQLYTKLSYGAVAVAFLCFMLLLDPRQRHWAAAAILVVVAAALLIELSWGGTSAHLRDLVETARVSGGLNPLRLVALIQRNLSDLVIFALLGGLVLRCQHHRVRDVLFYAFCFGSGLMILNQNAHTWGMITLHAGAVVAAERVMRDGDRFGAPAAAGVPLLLLALVLPPTLYHASALSLHSALAAVRAGEPLSLRRFEDVLYTKLWAPGDHGFSRRYVQSIGQGGEVLSSLEIDPERVAVLDFVNPFSSGLGLPPPKGDLAWMHWGRNLNTEHHLPAETLLGDVKILMEPKIGINSIPLRELYGDYIDENFRLVRETAEWKAYLRREGEG